MHKLLLYLLLGSWAILNAQSFDASVSSEKIGEKDRLQVSFSFNGENINDLKAFAPPDFNNFRILSGPNQSTSMQIINGAVSGSLTYSYFLQPVGAGNFTIGSASINYKGETYRTKPVKITVVKGSLTPKENEDDSSVDEKEIAENLFIRAFADKQSLYLGEQLTVTYKLYTRLNIASQMSISKLPQYQGFWAEELETSNNITFTTENYNGKQYRVGVLKRVALFPSQTGELSVTPFELNVPVRIQKQKKRNNLFDDFFSDPFGMGETVEYNAVSNTIKVRALSLPQNSPESFTGAVGKFNLITSIDNKALKTGEPANYKITVSGSGNIQLLKMPEVKFPSGFEKYDPKTEEKVTRSGIVSGSKIFDYLIVPRTPGEKEIPPVQFTYFDPEKKDFVTLNGEKYTVNVEQGTGNYAGQPSKEDVTLLGDDIRYIRTETDLDEKEEIVLFNYGFWTAVGLPFFALIGLVVWKKRDEKLISDINNWKYQKARKIAKERLKKAYNLKKTNHADGFYTELSLALFGYLEDKLHIPKADFTLEYAVIKLQEKEVDNILIEQIKSSIEKCEYIRFAPHADGKAAMNEMYDILADIIVKLERQL